MAPGIGETDLERQLIGPGLRGVGGPVISAEEGGAASNPYDVVIIAQELRCLRARAARRSSFVGILLWIDATVA